MAMQDMSDDEREFAAAFNEGDEPAAVEVDEPIAEDSPAAEDGATAGEPEAVVLAVADGEALKEGAEQMEAEQSAPAAANAAEPADEGALDPKEEQRRKSWEGRLKAREEELARREAALKQPAGEPAEEGNEKVAEAIEKVSETLEQQGNEEGAEKAEQVAEQVENGNLSAEQAMKILAEDFGPEFVKMIEAIASSKAEAAGRQIAERATSELSQSVNNIINNIVDDRARSHFETIADKHPDFNEVAKQPEFAEFAKSYPNGMAIVENGSARDIVKMLDKFKAAQQPAEPDPAVDAAEGVRSKGLRLPEAPVKSDDYAEAWNQF